jgi:hypothetical protein
MKTAMQELREDLQLTIDTANNALLDIEDKAIRLACQEVVRLTLKNIIKRIDEELLVMEKQQIIDASNTDKYLTSDFIDRAIDNGNSLGEQHYKETFNK